MAALLLPGLFMLTACGGGDDEDDAAEQARRADQLARALATPTPAATAGPAASATPASTGALTLEERAAKAAGPGFAGGTLEVSRADFGEAWPFTVEDGLLNCRRMQGVAAGQTAVIFGGEDTAYPLNGTAQRYADEFGWDGDLDEIWADNPKIKGTKKNMGPVIDLGLKLCR